jgi:hypothetical protein
MPILHQAHGTGLPEVLPTQCGSGDTAETDRACDSALVASWKTPMSFERVSSRAATERRYVMKLITKLLTSLPRKSLWRGISSPGKPLVGR